MAEAYTQTVLSAGKPSCIISAPPRCCTITDGVSNHPLPWPDCRCCWTPVSIPTRPVTGRRPALCCSTAIRRGISIWLSGYWYTGRSPYTDKMISLYRYIVYREYRYSGVTNNLAYDVLDLDVHHTDSRAVIVSEWAAC